MSEPKQKPSRKRGSQALAITTDVAPVVSGRHDKDLTASLLAAYQGSLSEPEQTSLAAEIALIDSQLSFLNQQSQNGGGDWKEANYAYKLLRRGLYERDKKSQNEAFSRLDRVFEQANGSRSLREEIRDAVNLRRRLVESQTKAQQHEGRFIKKTDAEKLFNAVAESVRLELIDQPECLQRISSRFEKIMQGAAKL
ncbi:MAG: hypothetical protein M3X11_17265 [Acidobacteriota bacterium]|nr:hypothetical protein [Acidobacteriota bacterium]